MDDLRHLDAAHDMHWSRKSPTVTRRREHCIVSAILAAERPVSLPVRLTLPWATKSQMSRWMAAAGVESRLAALPACSREDRHETARR